jgi:hypothetical protein
MPLSRLLLATVVALRALLVYGEAAGAASAELTWRDLLPDRLRLPAAAPAPSVAPAASVAAARRYA